MTLTLTDTGGAVLTLMLGYRSLELKIASRILHTTRNWSSRILGDYNADKHTTKPAAGLRIRGDMISVSV